MTDTHPAAIIAQAIGTNMVLRKSTAEIADAVLRALADAGLAVTDSAAAEQELQAVKDSAVPATVYLAIGGEYDARWPRKVFARRVDAEQYGCADAVEEWPVQPGPIETRTWIRALWPLHHPTAADPDFDWVNPFDMDGYSEIRDYDGRADALNVEWYPYSHLPDSPWVVEISGWSPDLVTAAWKERRDRIVAARGELPLPLDQDDTPHADQA